MPSGSSCAPWEPWWAFNRDPYLNLKAVIHEGDLVLGSDNYFLGYAPISLVRDHLRPSEQIIREQVVPALLRVLEQETDNDLVTGALVALAKIGDPAQPLADVPRLADTFLPLLASPNQEIAETAAVSLGILANDFSIQILGKLLSDSEAGRKLVGGTEVAWRTRAFAAYGLGLIGYRSSNPDARRAVLDLLRAALEGQALTMATPDVGVACLSAMSLVPLPVDVQCSIVSGRSPSPSHCRRGQIAWLREYARRPELNYLVRSHLPTALARLARDTDADPRLRMLAAEDLFELATGAAKVQRDLRASAVQALGMLGTSADTEIDRSIRGALLQVAKESRQPELRTLALIALGQVGGRAGASRAADPEIVSELRSFLLSQFAKGRSMDRPWAALALGLQERATVEMGLSPSMSTRLPLRAAMRDAKSPDEVGAYAIALGVMQDQDAAQVLLEKLAGLSEDRSRGYICIGLGLMNARQGVEPLRDLLAKARYRPLLLREAAISLGLLGDKNVVDDLVEELHQATSLTAQSSIAAALGTIGDARSLPPLLEMLEDEEINVRARAFAAVALGIVADKEPLPWNAKLAVGANYLAGTETLTDGMGKGILDIL
jgi:HEAT repeat protein